MDVDAVEKARSLIRALYESWDTIDDLSTLNDAIVILIDWVGGEEWLAKRPRLLSPPDDGVTHARGLALSSGWDPPVIHSFEYRGNTLYLDRDAIYALTCFREGPEGELLYTAYH